MQRSMTKISEVIKTITFSTIIILLANCSKPNENKSVKKPKKEKSHWESVIDFGKSEVLLQMGQNSIKGLSIGIIHKDSLIWAKGFGSLGRSASMVNEETVFSMQSISKTFTAHAVVRASEQGYVDLDAPITRYLPNFKINSRFEAHPEKKISLRHLLMHRSGLTHEAPVGNNYDDIDGPWERHIKSIQKTWLKSEVGSHYSYSNLSYDLAAYIVEQQVGMSFETYVKKEIFEPLGMISSTFDHKAFLAMENKATGFYPEMDTVMPIYMPMKGAGGMFSNIVDLSKYVKYQLKPENYKGGNLTTDGLNELYYPHRDSTNTRYALGLNISKFRDKYMSVGHNGGGFGFSTQMSWYPELEFGLVILANREYASGALSQIERVILEQHLGDENMPSLSELENTRFKDEAERHEAQNCAGHYTNNIMTLELRVQGDEFGIISPADEHFIPISIQNKTQWYFNDLGTQWHFEVVMNENKEPSHLINHNNGLEFFFDPLYSKEVETKEVWRNSVGRYETDLYGVLDETAVVAIYHGALFCNHFRLQEVSPNVYYTVDGERVYIKGDSMNFGNVAYKRVAN